MTARTLALLVLAMLLTLLSTLSSLSSDTPELKESNTTITKTEPIPPPAKIKTKLSLVDSLVFKNDLYNNKYMSSPEKREFDNALRLAKIMFPKVPTTLIYTAAYTESTLNPRAKHSNKSDHGMCGINYYYNGDSLKKAGIIKRESDLDKITPNVLACAFLFNGFLSTTNGRVKNAILMYKGTDKNNRTTKLYALYKSTVQKVYLEQKS